MNFLDSVKPFTPKQWPEKEREISNWLKVAKIIYATEDKTLILRYLQLERLTRYRPMVVERLYSRFSVLRNSTEYAELTKTFPPTMEPNAAFTEVLLSWDYTVNFLKAIDYNQQGMILDLMKYEWASKRRQYLLKRLLTRYQALRRKHEKREVHLWNPRKVQSSF